MTFKPTPQQQAFLDELTQGTGHILYVAFTRAQPTTGCKPNTASLWRCEI